MGKLNVIVSGSNGQLARSILTVSKVNKNLNFYFFDKGLLDITSVESITKIFDNYKAHVFINCAAYTNVELAEKDLRNVNLINNIAVGLIAKVCKNEG